jgi:hypothetical protein
MTSACGWNGLIVQPDPAHYHSNCMGEDNADAHLKR